MPRLAASNQMGLLLIYKSGVAKVYFAEFPKEVQKRFGYDTDKIEAEQTAARAAEEKRVEEQKAAQRQRAKKGRKTESKVESKVFVKREITDKLIPQHMVVDAESARPVFHAVRRWLQPPQNDLLRSRGGR